MKITWRRYVLGALILGVAAIVLAVLVGVAWAVLAAFAAVDYTTSAPGRWGEPSGVANVMTACTDQGIRLYWHVGSDTATGVADPTCRAR